LAEDRLTGGGREFVDADQIVVVEQLGLERQPASRAVLDAAAERSSPSVLSA
jgi:hypothetical protein